MDKNWNNGPNVSLIQYHIPYSTPQSNDFFVQISNTVMAFSKMPQNFVKFYAFSALPVFKWPKVNTLQKRDHGSSFGQKTLKA